MENKRERLELVFSALSEPEFRRLAGEIARTWRSQSPERLVVGLDGPLGAGKTTWVRGMLEGLGYRGRVPSPTYTLLEHYELDDLILVHLDLYRLPEAEEPGAAGEFEALGVREWLARSGTWVLAEWPGRSSQLVARCDVWVVFEFLDGEQRGLKLSPRSAQGSRLLEGLRSSPFLDSSFSG